MERNSRTRLTTAAILILVFGSGALVGMAFDRDADAASTEQATGPSDEGEDDRDQRRGPVIDRIELSDKERSAVDAVIVGHRARMDSLNTEFRTTYYPRFYVIIDETRGLIMEELTAEQAATYKRLLADWDSGHPRDERQELPFRRRN